MLNVAIRTALVFGLAACGSAQAACSGTPPAAGGTVNCDDSAPNPDTTGVQGAVGVDNVTVNVTPATAQITVNGDGIRAQGPLWVVDNAGSITGGGGSTVGVRLTQGGNLTNRAGASISGVNAAVRTDSNPLTISNAGSIAGSGGGVLAQNSALTLVNLGSISSATATATGVRADSGNVTNSSTGSISGSNAGVLFESSGTVDNSGTISGGGAAVEFTTGGTLINRSGGVVSAVGNAVQVLGSGNSRIENAGILRDTNGSTGGAVAFSAGNDELVLQTGSQLDGNVTGGDGNDLLILQGSGSENANFASFETLNMDGSSWSLGGTLSFATISINSGVLGSTRANQFGNPAASMTVATGASFDLAGFSQSLGEINAAGTIQLGSGSLTTGALGSDTTLSGPISGSGGLTKVGAGTLTLSGNSSYTGTTTVSGGVLQLTTTSPQGPVALDATLRLALPGDASLAGNLSGGAGGQLVKAGPGTLTLSGNGSSYSGSTRIESGALDLTGSVGGSLLVQSGASLLGTGTAGALTVESGGTLSPAGTSTGTLSVGSATIAAGATYLVQLTPAGATDRLAATGAITLQGGTVQVNVPVGTYTPGTRWRIASGSNISGAFASVVFSDTTRGLRVEQSATAVDIVLPGAAATPPAVIPNNHPWALLVLLLAMLLPAGMHLRRR